MTRSSAPTRAPRHLPGTPDVASLAIAALTPSPSPGTPVTGKRTREDEWVPEEVEVLEGFLSRPLRQHLFPPGSMPPPHILDQLATAVLGSYRGDDTSASTDGYDASAEPSPAPSEGGSRATSPLPPTSDWPHSWEETRRMLGALALAETRLGAEVADRKLTRAERLAKPGIKRVGSMDFLEDEDDAPPAEKMGRVMRLSARLQSSAAHEKVKLQRAASMTEPAVCVRPFALTITPSSPEAPKLPSTMKRGNSAIRLERRPSLLARGRSFTASDLEAEAEEACRKAASAPVSNFPSSLALDEAPMTPTGSDTDMDDDDSTPKLSPRRRASAPENPSPRLLRSHSYSATSRRERDRRQREYPLTRPAPEHDPQSQSLAGPTLAGAFDPTVPPQPTRLGGGWDSDSDRSDREGTISVKRRVRPCLAMTAMAGAARRSSGSGSSGLGTGAMTPTLEPLALEERPGLASPFEDRPNPFN